MGCTASTAARAPPAACPMHQGAGAQDAIDFKSKEPTLFEKLGGMPAVEAAVEIFYKRIEADPEVFRFFEGVNMTRQRVKQMDFMCFAFGGAKQYTGRSLYLAHKKLITEKGLEERHFDMVAGHLVATLEELNVPENLISEVVAVVVPTKAAIFAKGE